MIYMVIEHFKKDTLIELGQRFRRRGRMLPAGVHYHASWVDAEGSRCFQVMEAPEKELLMQWTRQWDDLVEFEIIAVKTSSDFWSGIGGEAN